MKEQNSIKSTFFSSIAAQTAGFIFITLLTFGAYMFYIVTVVTPDQKTIPYRQSRSTSDTLWTSAHNKRSIDTIVLKPQSEASPTITRNKVFMAENPSFMPWYFCISMLNAFSVGLFLVFVMLIAQDMNTLKVGSKTKHWMVIASFIGIGVLTYLIFVSYAPKSNTLRPLVYSEIMTEFNVLFQDNKVIESILTKPSELCGGAALIGMVILVFVAEMKFSNTPATDWETLETSLVAIHRRFSNYSYAISCQILLGIICSFFLSEVLLGLIGPGFLLLSPKAFLWGYGLQYSCILILFYFPIHYYLRKLAQQVRTAAALANKEAVAINESFGNTTTRQVFWDKAKVVLAALTPLIGAAGIELVTMVQKLLSAP